MFQGVLVVVGGNHIHHIVAGECRGSVKANQVHQNQSWCNVESHSPYYEVIVVSGKAPDGDLVGRHLLLLDMRHDSRHINARVSVHRCKICYSPYEGERRPNFLPWAMSSYVLNKYSDMSPSFNLTADDVNMKIDSYRATPGSIVSHRTVRGFPGTVSVQYTTCWDALENVSWETEQDLEHYGNMIERYWAGEPKQVDGRKAKYCAYRVQMAKRSQARSVGEVYVSPGHILSCDSRCDPDMYSTDILGSNNFVKTTNDG